LSIWRSFVRRALVAITYLEEAMTIAINQLSAISLFVEDLAATKDFYVRVFDVPIVFEDQNSAVAKFENLLINLLKVENAAEIVEPGSVAPKEAGSRFQISIWVTDVDAVCMQLQREGVSLLSGPKNRAWGMRTANFVDPAGHSWEVAQQMDR
jgi:catechol 2,3-dioxygenase-like lactoylglutathione lyase family enzyme